jgi:hypothetical protein
MSSERLPLTSLPDCVEEAYEHVSHGINLLNILVIEDSILRLKKSGSALPQPDALRAMREALIDATVLAQEETLELSYADVMSFWKALCGFASESGLYPGDRRELEIWKSPLPLKDPRAISLCAFLRCVESLRATMFSETDKSGKLAEIPAIIAEGETSRMSLITPADRMAALDDIGRAVGESFDGLGR